MKLTLQSFLLLGSISLFSYCSPLVGKKTTKKAPEPVVAINTESFTEEDLVAGRKLMEIKCGDCHVLFEPIDFNAPDWEEILKSMLPKSKLTGKDAALVRHYIITNAKKS